MIPNSLGSKWLSGHQAPFASRCVLRPPRWPARSHRSGSGTFWTTGAQTVSCCQPCLLRQGSLAASAAVLCRAPLLPWSRDLGRSAPSPGSSSELLRGPRSYRHCVWHAVSSSLSLGLCCCIVPGRRRPSKIRHRQRHWPSFALHLRHRHSGAMEAAALLTLDVPDFQALLHFPEDPGGTTGITAWPW